jgi:hypothetical protein
MLHHISGALLPLMHSVKKENLACAHQLWESLPNNPPKPMSCACCTRHLLLPLKLLHLPDTLNHPSVFVHICPHLPLFVDSLAWSPHPQDLLCAWCQHANMPTRAAMFSMWRTLTGMLSISMLLLAMSAACQTLMLQLLLLQAPALSAMPAIALQQILLAQTCCTCCTQTTFCLSSSCLSCLQGLRPSPSRCYCACTTGWWTMGQG